MAIDLRILGRKLYQTFAAVRTGIILILVVGVFAALGTVILQRPSTDPEILQRAYSPQTLALLDRVGLTDVYHTWWFITLLALVSISIVFASLERWPNAWRFYARPYTYPEPHFRLGLQHKSEIPIATEEHGLSAARAAFRKVGISAKEVSNHKPAALFAERHRFAVMAVYVIHASLLLIFIGGMIDGVFGYRGFLQLVKGETKNVIEMRDRADRVDFKTIPFSVRCDDTGQENYADGSPKKWWSKLTVVDNGRDVLSKEIVVNDPLVYRGLRFYQASYGESGDLESLILNVRQSGEPDKELTLTASSPAQLNPTTTIQVSQFIPDFYIQDNEVHLRSKDPVNPAIQLAVNHSGKISTVWVFPAQDQIGDATPFTFELKSGKLAHFTGLEVSHEPGQYGVWAGCVLMGCGLLVAFYMVHMRFWAVPVRKPSGELVLWVGGAFNKNRDRFEEFYKQVVDAIQEELKTGGSPNVNAEVQDTLAGASSR
ncbi:MAG TPA: cytochrome c biogenesis protein ResB [Terriglobales bacterium]|nr:cytochrome c biogenesis protein ResB [Terriglobales bacterium]